MTLTEARLKARHDIAAAYADWVETEIEQLKASGLSRAQAQRAFDERQDAAAVSDIVNRYTGELMRLPVLESRLHRLVDPGASQSVQ